MKRRLQLGAIVVLLMSAMIRSAHAGMPMASLTDIATLRLETISFFVVCFLASSGLVWRIWNVARADFPRLPYLSYRKAIGLVALWGLLFLLVLTMISGARELLTPGAWRKQGLTYKLADDDAAAKTVSANQREQERRHALDRLRAALWTYARHHEGKFPSTDTPPEIPDELWIVPDASAMRYRYTGGLLADRGDKPLVYEPGIFGPNRIVLSTRGEIARMSESELRAALAQKEP